MSSDQPSLWEEPPANHSASPVDEQDWMTRVASWRSSFCDWWIACVPIGSSMKTSLECCRVGTDETLEPGSGRWSKSGIAAPGECWTHNGSEFPSNASVCSLSDILEPTGDIPSRYYKTPAACAGILRRAAKRERELPPLLKSALESVAAMSPDQWARQAAEVNSAVDETAKKASS